MGSELLQELTNEDDFSSVDLTKYDLEVYKMNRFKKSNKKFMETLIDTLIDERTTKTDKELYIRELQFFLVKNAFNYFKLEEEYEKIKQEDNKLNELRKYILKYRGDIK